MFVTFFIYNRLIELSLSINVFTIVHKKQLFVLGTIILMKLSSLLWSCVVHVSIISERSVVVLKQVNLNLKRCFRFIYRFVYRTVSRKHKHYLNHSFIHCCTVGQVFNAPCFNPNRMHSIF